MTHPSRGAAYTDAEIRERLANHEIGGGQGYLDTLSSGQQWTESDADVTVSTTDELIDACRHTAFNGETYVVWVADKSTINMTGEDTIVRSGNGKKVIAGNRGVNGEPGPIFYNRTKGENSTAYRGGTVTGTFQVEGDVEFFGLRFRGWAHDYWKDDDGNPHPEHPGYIERKQYPNYYDDLARGISIRSDDVEIHNCEIYGWATQGIYVGISSQGFDPHIHHCDLHDNMQTSFGYHIDVGRGVPLIEYNYLNAHRHAIDGFGRQGCGWISQYNVFGPSISQHEVDMHSLSNNTGSNTNNYSSPTYHGNAGGAGTGSLIHRYNTHTTTHSIQEANMQANRRMTAVGIRGVPYPRSGAVVQIHNNSFEHSFDVSGNRGGVGHQQADYEGAISQQYMRNYSPTFDFRSRLVEDDLTPNFRVYDNQGNASTSAYSSEYGAPIDLNSEASYRSYTVTITDSMTGGAIRNAEVTLASGGSEWIRTTNDNGVASFSGVPTTSFDQTIEAEGYDTLTRSVSISEDTSESLQLTPTEASVPDNADLTIVVSDRDTDEPLEDAAVTLWES